VAILGEQLHEKKENKSNQILANNGRNEATI
jgi:hypothetical protein